jgi:hypothetical protein
MEYILDSFLNLLHAVKDWMPNLFNIFSYSEVAIGLSLFLILLGISTFLYLFVVFYIPTKSKLEQLIDEVKQIKNSMDMAENFSYVNNAMRQVKFVYHPWRELRKHFVFPEPGTKGPIRSTIAPNEFFNMETAEKGGAVLSKYVHVPEAFIGTGLVLTFLGLISGIYFAAQGLGGDVDQAKAGLVQLLDAATFKFMTSIAGVGIATFFTVGYNKIYHNLQNGFVELSTLLEARILTATVETVAFAQHAELRKQTELLEKFTQDFESRLTILEKNYDK